MDDIYFDQGKIPKVDAKTLKHLSTLKPWRSFLAIFLDWLMIILCVALCEMFSYWLYPIAFIIVGSRFHGLEAMMHEATHYRLHPNRKINEFVGELSVWPLGLSLFLYRALRHFAHHKNIGTPSDSHIMQSYERHPVRFDIPVPFSQLLKNCAMVAVRFPTEVWLNQLYTAATFLPKFSKRLGVLWIGFQVLIVASFAL